MTQEVQPVVGDVVPLLARHLAGFAADADRGVGEEPHAGFLVTVTGRLADGEPAHAICLATGPPWPSARWPSAPLRGPPAAGRARTRARQPAGILPFGPNALIGCGPSSSTRRPSWSMPARGAAGRRGCRRHPPCSPVCAH